MDYTDKKPYRNVITSVIALVGFFVFVWHHEVIIKNISNQSASLVSVFGEEAQINEDPLFNTMVQYIQAQGKEIRELKVLNSELMAQIEQASSSTSTEEAVEVVEAPKRVLLVAGHTAQTKGAVFQDTTEYELNYNLLKKLEREMKERGYETIVSHQGGDYTPQFLDFFAKNEERILEFRENKKNAYDRQYPQGVVTNDTDHNHASPLGVVQLYGVNLWANENNIDAVIHLHFNDYPGRVAGKPGVHTGISVFTPLKTNNHFVESFKLGKLIEENMLKYTERSTVRNESAGVLESELIAVGQANSVNMPAVLIENGFVYENKFTNESQREIVFTRQANSIANGIERYFIQQK